MRQTEATISIPIVLSVATINLGNGLGRITAWSTRCG